MVMGHVTVGRIQASSALTASAPARMEARLRTEVEIDNPVREQS